MFLKINFMIIFCYKNICKSFHCSESASLSKSSSGQIQDGASSRAKARTPSSPASPLKEKQQPASFFGRVTNLSQVKHCLDFLTLPLNCKQKSLQVVTAAVTTYAGSYNKDRHFTLLVIDDCNTEWWGASYPIDIYWEL